jgi:hypothetical protein
VLPRMLMLYWRARRPKAQLIERLGAAVLGSLRAPGDDVAEIASAARAATA